ncbi:MAG: hypothetical protein J6V92_07920 [Bacteroidaceae bacterium]|nr:hypothetical protein [Bacteroidaceae bacterium]
MFRKVKGINAFRAYFQLNIPKSLARSFVQNFDGEEDTTGIISTTNFTNSDNVLY